MEDLRPDRSAVSSRLSIREFLIDLLGGLVPGILFVFLALVSLGWPIWTVIREIQKATPMPPQVLDKIVDIATAFRFEILIFFLVAAYVTGHFFFRQDPKEPDRRCFFRTRKKLSEDDKATAAVQKRYDEEKDEDMDVQFPYLFLHEYLESRNLGHLAKLVPWQGKKKSTWHRRTKAFINLLKIRLMFYFPESCGMITRNEAHVRLMSSIWYASRAITWVAFGGMILGLVSVGLGFARLGVVLPQNVVPILGAAAILVLAFWARRNIERFLHYQRIREVVFVLETAYNAQRIRSDFFDGLKIPAHD